MLTASASSPIRLSSQALFVFLDRDRTWSCRWVSPLIVPETSAASARMDSGRAWPRNGDVRFWPDAAKRGASSSPCVSRASTRAPDDSVRFPRPLRLTRKSDLETVIREGKRIRSRHLDIRSLASPLGHPRIGVIVPRFGHSAVDRNTLKRRLREIVRTQLLPVLPNVDLVIRSRPGAYDASVATLATELANVRTAI
jgi:ribonuclease P protein component